MKTLRFTKDGDYLRLEDYPDAAALVEIDGPRVPLLQSLSLHRVDLTLAGAALGFIAEHSAQGPLREVLWYSAVARYFKCFQRSESRIRLEPDEVFSEADHARGTFKYFKDLRNKHLLHDENAYSQCLVGAVINQRQAQQKIADVVSIAVNANSADQGHYESFFPLLHFTHEWVVARIEALRLEIASDLEYESYESLLDRKPLSFCMPPAHEVSKRR
ncbi:hypothetical protein ACS5PK_17050 [Roseateles sp. DB2]|uniref:hypothetical protein n=1 Tax=Roseateles sp. DB2 TaxID=3453717 RepID=UPI003EEC9891